MTSLAELLTQTHEQLMAMALQRGIGPRPQLTQDELCATIVDDMLDKDEPIETDGILAVLPEGFGFVRMLALDFASTAVDAYVSPGQVRTLNLQVGERVRGPLRAPRGTERFYALQHVDRVQDAKPEDLTGIVPFDANGPVQCTRRMLLQTGREEHRALQDFAPWSFGHRVIIHSPRANWPAAAFHGRLAASLQQQYPNAMITTCLLDQRPEDLAAVRHALREDSTTVVGTEFAAPPERHVAVADLALERAKRQAEHGRDAILLIDSLTALTRAQCRTSAPSGAWIQPGLDARAILPAKRLFASARQLATCQDAREHGGSLTVIATVPLGEPGTLDAAIGHEFAPYSNSDIRLSNELLQREHELPFDLIGTVTRPEDDPTPPKERARMRDLRAALAELTPMDRVARWRAERTS